MATTTGFVQDLQLDRGFGKAVLRTGDLGGFGYPVFSLYVDGDVDVVDPTEMVRRNWMIGLLQRALADGLQVTITHVSEADAIVEGVTLRAAGPAPTAGPGIRGRVRALWFEQTFAKVTILSRQLVPLKIGTGGAVATIGTSPEDMEVIMVEQPVLHGFYVYLDSPNAGTIHPVEIRRRRNVIGALQQALADDLEVSVTHGSETDAFVLGVQLHGKE